MDGVERCFRRDYSKACNFIKKEALAQGFSCEFREISKNTFSYRTPPVAASVFNTDGLIHSFDQQTHSYILFLNVFIFSSVIDNTFI